MRLWARRPENRWEMTTSKVTQQSSLVSQYLSSNKWTSSSRWIAYSYLLFNDFTAKPSSHTCSNSLAKLYLRTIHPLLNLKQAKRIKAWLENIGLKLKTFLTAWSTFTCSSQSAVSSFFQLSITYLINSLKVISKFSSSCYIILDCSWGRRILKQSSLS